MKRLLLLSAISAALLSGCANESEEVDTPEVEQQETNKEEMKKEKTKDKNKLNEVGDVVKMDNYTVTLQKYQKLDQQVTAGPLNIDFKEVKFIELSNVKGDFKKHLETEGFDTNDSLNYLQVLIEVENTSEDAVSINRVVDKLILNTGEQIELVENDMSHTQHLGDVYGGVKKEVILTPIYQGDVEDIETMKFVIDEVYNPETYEIIENTQQVDFDID